MISLYSKRMSRELNKEIFITVELRGLSTDDKPTTIGDQKIDNGSVFIEIDTGTVFLYDLDGEEWKEI